MGMSAEVVPLEGARAGGSARNEAMLGTVLIILLILLLIGLIPAWPYSRGWGYTPSGVVLLLAIIVVIALATGRI